MKSRLECFLVGTGCFSSCRDTHRAGGPEPAAGSRLGKRLGSVNESLALNRWADRLSGEVRDEDHRAATVWTKPACASAGLAASGRLRKRLTAASNWLQSGRSSFRRRFARKPEKRILTNLRGSSGPVRTVAWQGSAGDRRPYADQTRLRQPMAPLGVDRPHSVRRPPSSWGFSMRRVLTGQSLPIFLERRGNAPQKRSCLVDWQGGQGVGEEHRPARCDETSPGRACGRVSAPYLACNGFSTLHAIARCRLRFSVTY